MATRGRKPLPTAVKILEGDRGKGRRPLNRKEPIPNADQVKCPSWLMPEAKKEVLHGKLWDSSQARGRAR